MNSEMVKLFKYWITERESIRFKRDSHQLPPWSQDPIMNNNHFCNVRREDDRGTKEIRAVVHLHSWLDIYDLPWVYTMARLFNKASTLDYVLYMAKSGDWNLWQWALREKMSNDEKIFHTAYVVSTNGRPMSKIDFVAEVVDHVRRIMVNREWCKEAFKDLMLVPGIGSFLAGQIIADLKNDRYLEDAYDKRSWACIGPGSKKGLDYIFGGRTTERNFMDRLVYLRGEIYPVGVDIHNQDLQNCLCEFSKYVAIKQGTRGRSRPYHACK